MNNIFEILLRGLEILSQKLEKLFNYFFEGLLDYLEKVQKWLKNKFNIIKNYLEKLFIVLWKVLINLFKLSLFYIPSIILILIGNSTTITIAIIYFVIITLIGLTYGKKYYRNW